MKNALIYRLDLAGLILVILLSHVIVVFGQSTVSKGIEMYQNKNYYGAEKFFGEVVTRDKKNAEAWYYLGRIAFDKEQLEKTADYLEKATELDPENSEYFTWKGIHYLRMLSKVDFMKQAIYAPKALNSLEKAVELDKKNIEARIYLAGYYANAPSFAGGSREKAEKQFNAIFSINPDHKGALLQHGMVMLNFKEYDEARKSFDRIIKLDPDYFPAYYHMGRLSSESNLFAEQGELSLIRFIDLAPDQYSHSLDEAWWYLGNIYQNKGENGKAKKAYEKAASLDPENEDYQKSLKNIL